MGNWKKGWTSIADGAAPKNHLLGAYLSPNGFWRLDTELIWSTAFRRRIRTPSQGVVGTHGRAHPIIWAQLSLTYEGEKYIGTNYLNSSLSTQKILKPEGRLNLKSESESIEVHAIAVEWADRTTHKIAAKILSGNSNFSKESRKTLNIFLDNGSVTERGRAANYILLYLDRLNDRASSKIDYERRAAIQELVKFLNIYPSFRDKLPDELSVAADKLESEGGLARHNPSETSSRRITESELINQCRQLWERYYKKPTKGNLESVFDHIETMKSSKSENVKKERARCLRAANKEAKRLKVEK